MHLNVEYSSFVLLRGGGCWGFFVFFVLELLYLLPFYYLAINKHLDTPHLDSAAECGLSDYKPIQLRIDT